MVKHTADPRTSVAAAWRGPEMARRDDWLHTLQQEEIDVLEDAIAEAFAGLDPTFTEQVTATNCKRLYGFE